MKELYQILHFQSVAAVVFLNLHSAYYLLLNISCWFIFTGIKT